MKKKILYTLELLILMTIFFISGHLFSLATNPVPLPENSIFQLQERYSQKLQNQLQNFLEVLTGPGNVKTSVQLNLKNIHRTITQKEKTPNGNLTTTDTISGIVLESQHIAIIINQLNSISLESYKSLIQEGLGLDPQKGDTLSLQILPFYKVPFLTFGFSYLTLIRLAGVFLILFFILIIVLATLYFKEKDQSEKNTPHPFPFASDSEWSFLEDLTSNQVKILLHYIDKETLGQILQIAPNPFRQKIIQEIPAEIWQKLAIFYNVLPFSLSQSLRAKNKIQQIIKDLKEQKIL